MYECIENQRSGAQLCPLKPAFWWPKKFEINRVHTLHFSNTLFRTLSWPRSTKTRYSLLYSHSCHLCRSGPGQTSKKCIEKVQCTDSVDFKKFLPPEHPFSWSNKEQGHFSPCRLIILLVCCSMSIETDVLVVKKN